MTILLKAFLIVLTVIVCIILAMDLDSKRKDMTGYLAMLGISCIFLIAYIIKHF